MQKKSLLVALFCGALCLTGCLKNEESASVALVRGAKAEELKSLAALNNAKAAAEAVYAQAELTVANAEAKLREANAALVLAQAETEKVRAELLKVRVALAEVQVEEEKVRLQMLEADLEQKLAEVEAAVAKAEAEKQGWINVMEHAVADAERQALADALEILKAEDALQKYILTQEGAKADSAKAAGAKYFAALDEIQKLQLKSIRTKAEKALVEAGAIGIRDAIHFEMEQIEEEIAKKEAIVAYLKEHQGMTPEEAEAALLEARINLEAAFNAYAAALEAENEAKGAYLALDAKTSLFEEGWTTPDEDGFADFIEDNWGWQGRNHNWHSYVHTQNFIDYEDYEAVTYYGYADRTDPSKFIKLWKVEKPMMNRTVPMYPEKTVDWFFPSYEEGVIAPAEIYYDNIKAVLDSIGNRKKVEIEKDVKAAEDASAKKVEGWNATIAKNKEELVLIKKYVDARKDTVQKAEAALAQLVDDYNSGQVKKTSAQEAYYEYMLVNYNVKRKYFEAEIEAAKDTADAGAAYRTAKSNFDGMLSEIPGFTTDSTNKWKAMDDARKALIDAKAIADALWGETEQAAYNNALANYNPAFAYTHSTTRITENYTVIDTALWFYKVTDLNKAGSTQKAWIRAADNEEVKLAAWNKAKAALEEDPTNTALIQAESQAHQTYVTAANATIDAQAAVRIAQIKTEAEQAKYDRVYAGVEEAKKAYNDAFTSTDKYDHGVSYDKKNDKWFKVVGQKTEIAGTKQAAWFLADSTLTNAKKQVTVDEYKGAKTLKKLQEEALKAYKGVPDGKWTIWKAAYDALVGQFALLETEEYKNDKEVAVLYEAYQKEKKAADELGYEGKLEELRHLYNINVALDWPYTTNRAYNENNGYSWYVSNYHLDPKYEFVSEVVTDNNGKKVIKKRTVADFLFHGSINRSLAAINANLTENIADEPEALETQIAGIREGDKTLKGQIADVKAALEQYKAYESEYKTWVADREKAFKAWQNTRKASYEAMVDEFEAKSEYESTEALANGGMWVYDPEWTIWNTVYTNEAERNAAIKAGYRNFQQGFSFIPVNKAIEQLEGDVNAYKTGVSALFTIAVTVQNQIDNVIDGKKVTIDELQSAYNALKNIDKELPGGSIAVLNFTKKILEETLKAGKVTLQVVLDAFDEELAVIDEEIALQTKIAAVYKAIMNGWLGIVDDEDVEGETGPLDGEGEGDDEE